MAGKSWIQWLLPVEKKFFLLLDDLGKIVIESARHLVSLVDAEGNRSEHLKTIHDLELKADDVARELYRATRHSLVHPINPEDLFRLIRELDDIIDAIESTAARIDLFDIKEYPARCRESVVLIQEACGLVAELVGNLQKNGKASTSRAPEELRRRVSEIEETLDEITRDEFARFVRQGGDWREILVWNEIYHRLERAADHCHHTAWLLDEVTARNA